MNLQTETNEKDLQTKTSLKIYLQYTELGKGPIILLNYLQYIVSLSNIEKLFHTLDRFL